jgi:hypothetical protein
VSQARAIDRRLLRVLADDAVRWFPAQDKDDPLNSTPSRTASSHVRHRRIRESARPADRANLERMTAILARESRSWGGCQLIARCVGSPSDSPPTAVPVPPAPARTRPALRYHVRRSPTSCREGFQSRPGRPARFRIVRTFAAWRLEQTERALVPRRAIVDQSFRAPGSQRKGCRASLIDSPTTSISFGLLVPSPSLAAMAR